MSILRRCRGSCSNPRRCLDHLWFDVMYAGARYRMAANDFAVPRMVPGKPQRLPGNERFVLNPAAEYACLHAPSEVYGDLPPPLRWGDFEDIRVGTFDEIRAGFAQASGMPVQLFAVPR